MVFLGLPAEASDLSDPILYPSETDPAVLEPGSQFSIGVVLRLPLTPPPGVQQPRAWDGWLIKLRRRASIAFRQASPEVEYTARVLRIRPKKNNEYTIFAVTLPWMTPGLYDLFIEGSGFNGKAARAVMVGAAKSQDRDGVKVEDLGRGKWRLRSKSGKSWSGVIDVVFPMNGPGLNASIGGSRIEPRLVSLTRVFKQEEVETGKVGRIICYDVSIPASDAGASKALEISITDAPAAKRKIEFEWERGEDGFRPVDWRFVRLRADFPVMGAIWRFGDGDWGSGKHVRHRWLFSEEARVDVIAFDGNGNVSRLSESRSLSEPMSRGSCSCGFVGLGAARYENLEIFRMIWQLFE